MVNQELSGWTCRHMASEMFLLPSLFEMEKEEVVPAACKQLPCL